MAYTSGMHTQTDRSFPLPPWGAGRDGHSSIDTSLAGGIRRSYYRALNAEWQAYDRRYKHAVGRNCSPTKRVANQRQLRERLALLEQLLGPLLPISVMRIDANSRGGAVVLALKPDPIPTAPRADSCAQLHAWVLFQPGHMIGYEVPLKVTGHAIDRVVQRAHIVDTPISKADIQAINAEFADALPLGMLAVEAINRASDECAAEVMEPLQIVLPTSHGAFLAAWSEQEKALLLRTFVDRDRLVMPQQEALRVLRRFSDMYLALHVMECLAEGWYRADTAGLCRELTEAWLHYGWRFDLEGLHPGLSDRAWTRDDAA